MEIRTEVKAFLRRKGWTQRRLAREIGVQDGVLSRFLAKEHHKTVFALLLPVLYGEYSHEQWLKDNPPCPEKKK
jgi:transcriptional regulator with XRE-family HTH domain